MRKHAFVKFVVVPIVGINIVCAAAAVPPWIGNRMVDRIMDWGDKHIGGPFKKGGGDEAATRQVLSDVVMPVKAWRAVLDITAGGESNTATSEQDTPGWSPQGVPSNVPQGQVVVDPQPAVAPPQASSSPERTHDPSANGPLDHVTVGSVAAKEVPAVNSDLAGTATQTPTHTIQLRAGENTLVQVNKEPVVNMNPELANGEGSATASPQVAPSPAPVAPTTATPQRAPDHIGPPDHGDPMHGAERVDHGNSTGGTGADASHGDIS